MLSVKKYTPTMAKDWDVFVLSANNGTIFQTRKFLNYHIDRVFCDHSLCFYLNSNLIATFPAVYEQKNKKIVSHPGASYGGIIIGENLKFSILYEIILLLDNYCNKNNFNSLFLINSPAIYWKNYDASLEYALEYNSYYSKEIYIAHAVQLHRSKSIINYIDKRKKRYLKNLLKNKEFKIIESNEFNEFYQLLQKNKKRFLSTPTHSLQELEKLNSLFSNKVKLFLSLHNNLIVGGALLLITNELVSLVFYNVIDENFRHSQLAAYQLYHCAQISEQQGMKFVDFGVSQNPEQSNPFAPKLSLINFKEQFNASGIWRRAYQKDFNV